MCCVYWISASIHVPHGISCGCARRERYSELHLSALEATGIKRLVVKEDSVSDQDGVAQRRRRSMIASPSPSSGQGST